MPIYEYQARDPKQACDHCRDVFEELQPISADALTTCAECGAPLKKLISAPSVGSSQSNFDDRAKNAGFSKLKRLGHGEYEKQY